ncbi:hypothetical protein [Photobacterium damselae]|uniref:hypothetical protein n=1 Tax=Photobacterium damselae TaxID=38293 RepID=UPI004067D165
MIFNQNDVIDAFIHSFSGLAALRDHHGRHLLINKEWERIVGSVTGKTIQDISSLNLSPLINTSLVHCSQCDNATFYHNQPTYNFEFFNNKRYITTRIPVEYRKTPAILILGVLYN